MIQGFFLQSSALPGDDVSLRVATDAPQFRVDIYRQGATFDKLLSTDWQDGENYPGQDHISSDDWSVDGTGVDENGEPQGVAAGWNGLTINIPGNWSTGVYIAILVEGDDDGNPQAPLPDTTNGDARNGKALLVLRNPNPGTTSQLLYKLPFFTYQSYNSVNRYVPFTVGTQEYYPPSSIYQGVDVSLRRPGGGTGGTPWDVWNFDPWDNVNGAPAGTPRQTFQHWDAKLIAWLEGLGYRIDYCTDLDIHGDDAPSFLSAYSVVLSVGHDEYYSASMRTNLEGFIAGGGNVAFLSGNTCWWRTEIDSQSPFVMHGQQKIHNWSDPVNVGQPEDSLTGVSFRNAGEGDENRPSIGFIVQNVDEWPFEGTGLSEGDEIGGDDGLIGYECDGAPYDKNSARPFQAAIDPSVGTPANLVILGTADVAKIAVQGGEVLGNGGATMAMYSRNGTVFTGATTDWPRVAALGDARVGAITRNVLDRFGGNPKGLSGLAQFQNIIACDGFFSADDNFRHAIVGTENGEINEVFYNPQVGQGQTLLTTQAGLVDLAAFYTDDDHFRHVMTIAESGSLVEVFYSPVEGLGQAPLGNIPNAIRIAGFYSRDDDFRHAIVATEEGEVVEVFFNPNKGQGQVSLGNFPGLIDIGAFFSQDDDFRHVLVGSSDGNVTEIFFDPEHGLGTTVVGNVPGLHRISAYYAAGDNFFNRRVQVMTQDGRIYEIRYHPKFGIMRAVLINLSTPCDIGGFYTPDDEYRHSVVAGNDGSVQELFFKP